MAEFTLWSLNRATPLIASREGDLAKIFEDRNHILHFGERLDPIVRDDPALIDSYNVIEPNDTQQFINHAYQRGRLNPSNPNRNRYADVRTKKKQEKKSAKHRLMHEGPKVDEYFVPIPLKVLGDPENIDRSTLSNSGKTKLDQILSANENRYFQDRNWLEKYWNIGDYPDLDQFPRVRMNTAPESKKGYYQILQDYKAKFPARRNILVGYSQGGLVARFLAAVDQEIFEQDLIAGVITIGSPNAGSPLANPENSDDIVNGVAQLLFSIFNMTEKSHPNFYEVLTGIKKITIEDFDGLLAGLIKDAERTSNNKPRADDKAAGLRSLRKWMTGIVDSPYTAFSSLDLKQISQNGTVLKAVNDIFESKALIGSIVNANESLPTILKQAFPISAAIDRLLKAVTLAHGTSVYQKSIMNESVLGGSDRAIEVIKQYLEGVSQNSGLKQEGSIAPRDHDFVIPSNSQLSNVSEESLLANIINEKSNHLSGGTFRKKAGRKNVTHLERLLEKMATQLS